MPPLEFLRFWHLLSPHRISLHSCAPLRSSWAKYTVVSILKNKSKDTKSSMNLKQCLWPQRSTRMQRDPMGWQYVSKPEKFQGTTFLWPPPVHSSIRTYIHKLWFRTHRPDELCRFELCSCVHIFLGLYVFLLSALSIFNEYWKSTIDDVLLSNLEVIEIEPFNTTDTPCFNPFSFECVIFWCAYPDLVMIMVLCAELPPGKNTLNKFQFQKLKVSEVKSDGPNDDV